jgi:putative transcriptional regulator
MSAVNQYPGYLLVANPNNPRDPLSRSVILITEHQGSKAVGLQLNKPMTLTLKDVATNIGLEYTNDKTDIIYHGGGNGSNKIHILHSSDWHGSNTIKLTSQLSITHDISVLSAISQDQGPKLYRACLGFWMWNDYRLDYQLDAFHPLENHRWEVAPANLSTVFDMDGADQWRQALEDAAQYATDQWF